MNLNIYISIFCYNNLIFAVRQFFIVPFKVHEYYQIIA
jgi:hypothetical protein